MLRLDELAQFLDQYFAVQCFGDDQGGVYRQSTRPIQRLGLALEPWNELSHWVGKNHLDALFLHRPWTLEAQLEPDVGVVAYHLAFDERLTLGFNPRLAIALGLSGLEVLGEKAGRPIGMIGEILPQSFASYCHWLDQVFGGCDAAELGGCQQVGRVAVVGAMSDALVREAAARGATAYVTGQFRTSAAIAIQETGIGVVAVGHRRCEEWGLRALAGVMRERWAGLEVILAPNP